MIELYAVRKFEDIYGCLGGKYPLLTEEYFFTKKEEAFEKFSKMCSIYNYIIKFIRDEEIEKNEERSEKWYGELYNEETIGYARNKYSSRNSLVIDVIKAN